MPASVVARPTSADFAPYYAKYIDLTPAGDLVAILQAQAREFETLLRAVPEARAGFAYADGKWTVREVVGHLTDTERVFAYRATAFSRADAQPLPSFDEAAWNPHGAYNDRPLSDVIAEWVTTRMATVSLLRAMPGEGLSRRGVASGMEITALACLTLLPGHVVHHLRVLQQSYGVPLTVG